eukprot:CAMPEP_0119298746 /NCGR_PEP_ID=MMETSP1333-20130426/906_1 /TAXON_ID=418940 /ORGANISM="Scyphosphaera apsteinii, Strain RCC1455" /LENGTH=433 /DNA_ID=CAMNT_0007299939 /DNA_START=98 /DNA_END=1399 /DNA_ORIENTATION=-
MSVEVADVDELFYAVESGKFDTTIIHPGTYILMRTLIIDANMTLINKDPEQTAILDGNSTTRVLEISVGTVKLRGLQVTRGKLQAGGYGAGILVESGVVTLETCIISSNNIKRGHEAYGAGVAIKDGTTHFYDCTLFENDADASGRSQGGGLHVEGGVLSLTNCNIHSNNAWGDYGASGGGISIVQGQVILTGCSIFDNLATWTGGGIAIHGGSLFAHNSVISDNGAYNYETKDMRKDGDFIFSSVQTPQGGGISARFTGKVAFSSCLIQNNVVTLYEDDFFLEVGSNLNVAETAELCVWGLPDPVDVEGNISDCAALPPFPQPPAPANHLVPQMAAASHLPPALLPAEVVQFLILLGISDISGSRNSLSSSAIAGIVVDSLAIISVLVLALLWFARRHTSKEQAVAAVSEKSAALTCCIDVETVPPQSVAIS